jgi:Zn-dependent metalloprotease/uncharacterized membrane protein
MKRGLTLLLFLALVVWVNAQHLTGPAAARVVPGADVVRYSESTQQVQYIHFAEGGPTDLASWLAQPQAWMPHFSGRLTFAPISVLRDRLGMVHRRLQLRMDGIPVETAVLVMHERNGRIVAVNGDLYGVDAPQTQPWMPAEVALQKALDHVGAAEYFWESGGMQNRFDRAHLTQLPQGELVFAPQNGVLKPGNFKLAWKFDVFAAKPLSRQWIYVDAETGELIHTENRLQAADVVGSAVTRYSGTMPITTDQTGLGAYRLRETGRGGGIETLNCLTGTDINVTVDFTDADNFWNNVTPAQDECATDAHIGAEFTYDYYHLQHGWDSYDGNNALIQGFVHIGQGLDYAVWTGSGIAYGDGNSSFGTTPLTTFDIVAHEFTHGVTQHTAGLVYYGQPGGLNESFSDIFGKAVEHYAKPNAANWLIGAECTNGVGIRSMADPRLFQNPGCYNGQYWQGATDPHQLSGVQNHWFYILTVGDTGVNEFLNPYAVAGLGYAKAEAIAFRNLSVYLTPGSEYADARFYAILAAEDLYGTCSTEQIQTANAWYAVNVGTEFTNQPQVAFVAQPHHFCTAPVTAQFVNNSSIGASFLWDFGDGTTSTLASPTHTYTSIGSYTVKLVVTGCTGLQDSLTQANCITLGPQVACPVAMPSTDTTLVTDCIGTILDSGGQGDYLNGTHSFVTIAPTGADYLLLDFRSFDTESYADLLFMYDGPDSTHPSIGAFFGPILPFVGTFTSSSGTVTLEFISDPVVARPGFELDFECRSATGLPVAAFGINPIGTCDGHVYFGNGSLNHPNTWSWDFGDGTTSNLQNPHHAYTTPGTYTVTLIACNSVGCDTEVVASCVHYEPSLPECNTVTLPNNSMATFENCSGYLQDDGGLGNYSDNQHSIGIIAPPGATQLQLSFTNFALEDGVDFLSLYDGNSTAAPLIGSYTGYNLPASGQPILATSGALTLEMVTDSVQPDLGFELHWSSMGATTGPQAMFAAPTTATIGQVINFTDQSTNTLSWNWDFGDGGSSTLQNPSHSYAAAGVYTVSLRTYNSSNCEGIYTQPIYVGIVGMAVANGIYLNLWPNPTRDRLHLDLRLPTTTDCEISVLNAWGQRVYACAFEGIDHLAEILDLSQFARGMYFVHVQTAEGVVVKKVVLE